MRGKIRWEKILKSKQGKEEGFTRQMMEDLNQEDSNNANEIYIHCFDTKHVEKL